MDGVVGDVDDLLVRGCFGFFGFCQFVLLLFLFVFVGRSLGVWRWLPSRVGRWALFRFRGVG